MNDVYMICKTPYNPSDPTTLNYGLGNLVALRVMGNPLGDYFRTHAGKILSFTGNAWSERDTLDNGSFFYLNGALASYNPQPGGVSEFRCSRIPNA